MKALALGGAGALSVIIVVIGMALTASETRHDEELLTLVGATPRTRATSPPHAPACSP